MGIVIESQMCMYVKIVVTPCSLVHRYQHLRWNCCLHLQGRWNRRIVPKSSWLFSEVQCYSVACLRSLLFTVTCLYLCCSNCVNWRHSFSSLNRKMLYIKEPGLGFSSEGLLLPFAVWTWRAVLAAAVLFVVVLVTTSRLGSRYERQRPDDSCRYERRRPDDTCRYERRRPDDTYRYERRRPDDTYSLYGSVFCTVAVFCRQSK